MSYLVKFKQDVADLRGKRVDFHLWARLEHSPKQGWIRDSGVMIIDPTEKEGYFEASILHIQRIPIVSDNPRIQEVSSEVRSLIRLTQPDVDVLLVLPDGSLEIRAADAPEVL